MRQEKNTDFPNLKSLLHSEATASQRGQKPIEGRPGKSHAFLQRQGFRAVIAELSTQVSMLGHNREEDVVCPTLETLQAVVHGYSQAPAFDRITADMGSQRSSSQWPFQGEQHDGFGAAYFHPKMLQSTQHERHMTAGLTKMCTILNNPLKQKVVSIDCCV